MNSQKEKQIRPRQVSSIKMALAVFYYSNPLVEFIMWVFGRSAENALKNTALRIWESDKKHFLKNQIL
jgi:hypothetical protein